MRGVDVLAVIVRSAVSEPTYTRSKAEFAKASLSGALVSWRQAAAQIFSVRFLGILMLSASLKRPTVNSLVAGRLDNTDDGHVVVADVSYVVVWAIRDPASVVSRAHWIVPAASGASLVWNMLASTLMAWPAEP